jgi:hypothetical protein
LLIPGGSAAQRVGGSGECGQSIPVLAINSRTFAPFIPDGATVGAIYERASTVGPDLNMLHDTRGLTSTIVFPEQATVVIDDLELDHDIPAAANVFGGPEPRARILGCTPEARDRTTTTNRQGRPSL